ncbi:MAG TPA: S8 family serine peptidase [Anaerolineaceae bacterium]|nr:S8 family serine peptidase [Anaerolineaceae bacterium]
MKAKIPNLLTFVVILTLALSTAVAAQKPESVSVKDRLHIDQVLVDANLKNALKTSDGKVRVIVQLSDAPLATYSGGIAGLAATTPSATGRRKLDVESAASVAYINHLNAAQADFVNRLNSVAPGAAVNFTYQAAFNGLSLTIDPTKVSALATMTGVTRVYPDIVRTVTMDASLPLINAPAMWAKLGGRNVAGAGIKIADVDTGLRVANPMFAGTGFTMPVGYPKGYCADHPSDTDFQCNNKVIAARVFVDPTLPVAAEEVAKPLDIDGHGSHTAGTASGNKVTVDAGPGIPVETVISGVAPGAYLMVYKALFEAPDHSSAFGTDSSLIAALNAALSDGADVINNSWGGGAGADPGSSVERPVIEAITAAGTLVVFSAGNDGPANGTIGCPGCVEDALTVAASTTSRTYKTTLVETAISDSNIVVPPAVQSITGRSLTFNSATAQMVDLSVEGYADAIACTGPVPSGIASGKIVVIKRGICALVDKVINAQAGGAVGAVIRNVAGGASTLPLINAVIPTVHITQTDGDVLAAFLTTVKAANATVTYKINGPALLDPTGDQADVVASFSSTGPNGNANVLKPDITAPGVNILSAFSGALTGGEDPTYTFLQGTSMAAPHITGSAALVMEQHPTWTPAQVKTALTSTSIQALKKPDGVTQANPFDMGAGRVDLARASNAGVTFDKPSFANGNCIVSCSWTRTIKNASTTTETWTANVLAASGLGLTVSPTSFTLAPGLSGDFTVTADPTTVTPGNWAFGSITWKNGSATYTDAYMPVAVRAGTSSNSAALTKTVSKTSANAGEPLTYTLTIGNSYVQQGTFFLNDPLPANLTYVDSSASGGLTYDPATRSLKATKSLAGVQANVAPTGNATIYTPHTPDPVNDLILSDLCPSPCDDTLINITGVNYYYLGVHYTRIGVTSNGGLIVGGGVAADATSSNQLLPNPAPPNNVIAPLWGDLVMKGSNPGDTATGIWIIWGDATHTVYEWQNAQHFDNPADHYTFQVWFEDGTNHITIAYGNLAGSLTTHNFTVGMENSTGTAGSTYYYVKNGPPQGTAPVVGTDLAVNNNFATQVYTFQATGMITDFSKPFLYNVADLQNNLNVDKVLADAKTNLTVKKTFVPAVYK